MAGEITVSAYEPFRRGIEDDYVERLRDVAARDIDAEVWVAEDDGVLIGSVTLCPEGSRWREVSGPGEGEFRMLAVHPSAQGRGVGAALVQHVLDRFTELGASAVVLSSTTDMTAAHRLYERLGFERAPDLDWGIEELRFLGYRKEL